MKEPGNIDTKLYSTSDLARIIRKYEELFRFLRRKLGKDFVNDTFGIDDGDTIVDLKRWLVDGPNRMFWDYLCATHGIMEYEMSDGNLQWQFNINDWIGCTKLVFWSGKEVIFTRENLLHKHPKWVISLDKFFYELIKVWGIEEFTKISNEIYKMEVSHFQSQLYLDKKDRIMKSSKEEIIKIFRIIDTTQS